MAGEITQHWTGLAGAIAGMKDAPADIAAAVEDRITRSGEAVANQISARVPVGATGQIRKKLTVALSGSGVRTRAKVKAGGLHAVMVEKGSRAHEITPNKARALFLDGRFAARVERGAIAPRDFFGQGVDAGHTDVEREFGTIEGEVFGKISAHVKANR